MVFVGRGQESARVVAELSRRRNVVVSGTYGVGRTTLVKHVADVMGDAWRFLFLDFSRTPAQVCVELLRWLDPVGAGASGRSEPSLKSARARILRLEPRDRRQRVIVLDNACTVTVQKLKLLRPLVSTRRYRFVAITDNHIRGADLLQLRASLYPVSVVTLSNLPRRHAREFFARIAADLHLDWGEGEIAGLASVPGGYPHMMMEAAARAARRSQALHDVGLRPTRAREADLLAGHCVGRNGWGR